MPSRPLLPEKSSRARRTQVGSTGQNPATRINADITDVADRIARVRRQPHRGALSQRIGINNADSPRLGLMRRRQVRMSVSMPALANAIPFQPWFLRLDRRGNLLSQVPSRRPPSSKRNRHTLPWCSDKTYADLRSGVMAIPFRSASTLPASSLAAWLVVLSEGSAVWPHPRVRRGRPAGPASGPGTRPRPDIHRATAAGHAGRGTPESGHLPTTD